MRGVFSRPLSRGVLLLLLLLPAGVYACLAPFRGPDFLVANSQFIMVGEIEARSRAIHPDNLRELVEVNR